MKYSGDWVNDKRHGFGVLWEDHKKYAGEWIEDQFDGFGVYYEHGIPVYTGQWKKHQRHGWGTYHKTRGLWKEDQLVEELPSVNL